MDITHRLLLEIAETETPASRSAIYASLCVYRTPRAIDATFRDFLARQIVTSADWHDAVLTSHGVRRLAQQRARERIA